MQSARDRISDGPLAPWFAPASLRFDLGLQLDSAEVRGVLMTEDGIECGAATFEFLGT